MISCWVSFLNVTLTGSEGELGFCICWLACMLDGGLEESLAMFAWAPGSTKCWASTEEQPAAPVCHNNGGLQKLH
jgi:hypothetical protein